jgi:hypothetical protein
MNWTPSIDYVEATPMKRRGTKKKVWNNVTNSWRDVTIWTVDATRELRTWLEETYPTRKGWGSVWSDTKIMMEEPIYLHYYLKFGL